MTEGDVVDGFLAHAGKLKGAAGDLVEGEGAGSVEEGEESGVALEVHHAGVGGVAVGPAVEGFACGGVGGEGDIGSESVEVEDGVAVGIAVAVGDLVLEVGRALDGDVGADEHSVVVVHLDHLVAARHEEVPVAGELVKSGSVGVAEVDAFEGDS